MIVPDANLLIYAYDSTSPHHDKAKSWWEDVLSGDEPIGVPWVVVLAFSRLMTHPAICCDPLTTHQVRQCVEHWLAQQTVRILSPSPGTLVRFFDLLDSIGLGGNFATDALIAAHAMENTATVYSNDRDFGRFTCLRWRNPLEE